jgi:hypothetical protein
MTWSWDKKTMKSPEMWLEFYECIHKKRGTVHVVCKYCRKAFLHPNKIGKSSDGKPIPGNNGKSSDGKLILGSTTTSMSRHLRECIPYQKQQPSSQKSMDEFGGRMITNNIDDDILNKVLRFFISGNIAFNQADNSYFQELIQTAHVKANQPVINRKNI